MHHRGRITDDDSSKARAKIRTCCIIVKHFRNLNSAKALRVSSCLTTICATGSARCVVQDARDCGSRKQTVSCAGCRTVARFWTRSKRQNRALEASWKSGKTECVWKAGEAEFGGLTVGEAPCSVGARMGWRHGSPRAERNAVPHEPTGGSSARV